jgi:predicted nuclease of restriction endonuclease-like RecB superfamily
LARKAFIAKSIFALEKSINIQKEFIEFYKPYNPISILDEMPTHVSKLHSYTESIVDTYIKNWSQELFDKSQVLPENLIYPTPNGVMVRSKSESIIAGILEAENIPYRYEAALKLGGRTYFPDFTILTPWNKKIIYWEHFGMADKPEYVGSMLEKLTTYRKNGLFPWYNLIETYESERYPFDVQRIRMIIHRFLMP